MKKKYHLLLALLMSSFTYAQVVINELDTDTPGVDIQEFVELKSSTPFLSLNGYVLVFFNAGTGNTSYLAMDLDGLTTDANGIVTIGNNAVSPVPNRYLTDNSIQNGADGIGLYLGNGSNFPTGTLATTTNLIDALIHETNDADPVSLMAALGETVSYDEALNGASATESIQRKNDGTYETKIPTPSANNDGSGTVLNGLSVTVTPSGELSEPNAFTLTFATQSPVTSDLNFTYTLTNGTFDTADYSGDLSVLIATGTSSTVKNITLMDDVLNEGDETMKIVVGSIPVAYIKLNDNVEVRIHDNDYAVQAWGKPTTPTYGIVSSTAPVGYYASLEGKSGAVLKQAIQDIIANPAIVRAHNYGDAYDILKDADQNPENSSQVWLMYVEEPRSKLDLQTGTSGAAGFWNREHIYCQSRGGFADATSNVPDGIGVWSSTDANDIAAGHADAHHIRAEDSPENSLRSNRNYGVDYNGPSGTQGSWHGDVARALFYMATRYNGLNVVNGDVPETPDGYIGDLATLLTWNHSDPSDDFEMNRNNYVYTWQVNRNPFIDHPDLADYIWGIHTGEPWFATLAANDFDALNVAVYPNPAQNEITVSGLNQAGTMEIFTVSGMKLLHTDVIGETRIHLDLTTGIYLAKITSENKTVVKKIVIK
jgi:hypothetical protein